MNCIRCEREPCSCEIPTRLTLESAQAARDEWGFNCGPAALCAVLGVTPEVIRPWLGDFEGKRFVNPTLMQRILKTLGFQIRKGNVLKWPAWGLCRVQWGGPWCRPGVPAAAAYHHTHWVAAWHGTRYSPCVFDVNLLARGGWSSAVVWSGELVPWLIQTADPKSDGTWWLTHVICLDPYACRSVGRRLTEMAEVRA